MTGSRISRTAEWQALRRHADDLRAQQVHLSSLFADDPNRVEWCTSRVGDLVIDWSKHLVTRRTLKLLAALAVRAGVSERLGAMMSGEPVNRTEGRPALHTALRASAGSGAEAGSAVAREAAVLATAERERMAALMRSLRAPGSADSVDRRIRTVVSLGIGGSSLGPAMAYVALEPFRVTGIECRFVSNVDPAALSAALVGLDPIETLFIVVSKSFTTAETLANARVARSWLIAGSADPARHFVAVTADTAAAVAFGVAPDNVFAMWDWVGGRFSLGSAAGLGLMASIGEHNHTEMLAGMRAVDDHLSSARDTDAPDAATMLGLLAVWYRNFWGLQSRAVIAYSQRLRLFADWLAQVTMESNGKRIGLDGEPVAHDTGEIVWGGVGSDSQHSFHQLLHQGTTVVPADFVVFANPDMDMSAEPDARARHEALVANCFAQSAALAFGFSDADDLHRELPGNRPSTVIMAPQLTPYVLGQLVALYEHQVVVQGAVWGINSFDQFGVEHGKRLADTIAADLAASIAGLPASHDPATAALINRYHQMTARS